MSTTLSDFFALQTLGDTNEDRNAFVDDYVQGLEAEDWKTKFGHPTAATWPVDATIRLRDSSGRRLTDLLGTIQNTIFASKRLRAVIADAMRQRVEYLPFRLQDHRGRDLSREYAIVNPLGTFDCLDLQASDVVRDTRDKDKVRLVNRPALSRRKVADCPPLFRVQEAPAIYVITAPLSCAIKAAGCTNIVATQLEIR